jgi:nitrite reductase/ring-hydroxylating ferredoxin subunit
VNCNMEKKLNLKIADVSENQAVKIELDNIELLITKIDGKYYAVGNRCGHMNVSLSEGKIQDGIVTCPMHKAKFDLRNGLNMKAPNIPKMLSPTKMGKLMNQVKTHNLPSFPIIIKDDELFVDI